LYYITGSKFLIRIEGMKAQRVKIDKNSSRSGITEELYHRYFHTLHSYHDIEDLIFFDVNLREEDYPWKLDATSKHNIHLMKNRLNIALLHDFRIYMCQTKSGDIEGDISLKRTFGKIHTEVSYEGKNKHFTLFRIDTERDPRTRESIYDMFIGKDIINYFQIRVAERR